MTQTSVPQSSVTQSPAQQASAPPPSTPLDHMTRATPTDPIFAFDNSYARMSARFSLPQFPTPVSAPRLIRLNVPLALALGLDPAALAAPDSVGLLAGNRLPAGSAPIATAYAGHQFGGFSPQLGDGRAVLLGEIIAPSGARYDIQLKGAGPTPFSRRGDGRAALGPVLREYIVSEAMAALGIPTTRALAAVATGDLVYRETPLPGGVLTRVASSHIRVGTFQFFAARKDTDAVRELADHVIARHYPDAARAPVPYLALLQAVIARQADLIARWMLVGFIHGVMNTDNSSIAGETIDYGPCAFMDSYDPATVYSSIDQHGRYAFANQPTIAQWNLTRFAETLLPLLADDTTAAIAVAQSALDGFAEHFTTAYGAGLRAKLGLTEALPDDMALAQDLLTCMAANKADFTLTFRGLCASAEATGDDTAVRGLFADPSAFDAWAIRWRQRLALEPVAAPARGAAMCSVNPAFIPRNHNVEAALAAAVTGDDYAPFEKLVMVLSKPFEDQPDAGSLMLPPGPQEIVRATFCGT